MQLSITVRMKLQARDTFNARGSAWAQIVIWAMAAGLVACCQTARADLQTEVRAVLADKLLARAEVGIQIVRLEDSAENSPRLFKHDSDIPLIPASNLKLITTAAAIDKLGADFKFRTRLAFYDGSLVLIGDGDPTLGDAELLKKAGWDSTTLFKNWADIVKQKGIKELKGVVVDDSVFEERFVHPNWPADQLHKRYMAGVGGLNLNANCLDFYLRPTAIGQLVQYRTDPATHYARVTNTCVGGRENAVWLSRLPVGNDIVLRGEIPDPNEKAISVTVYDPPMFAGTVLSETLAAAGINITGPVRRDRTRREKIDNPDPADALDAPAVRPVVLAIHETSLVQVITRANKDSMNLYAEALCKRIGFAATGKSGSWENGPTAVGKFLRSAGVVEDQFHLDDGCGLSKHNTITASAITRVLMHEYFSPHREMYIKSLAVAGVDGTLDDRFKGSDLRGRVFAKSGFVAGTSCLSGFLTARDGRWYAFSILMNGIPEGSNSSIKPLQERIVKAIEK